MAGIARSQTSYDLTFASEYAARGAALDPNPALQLRIEHDAETERYAGWYAGAFASPAAFFGHEQGQLSAYTGRALRLTSTLSIDLGATATVFTRTREWNYHEFYAGLALPHASARLFYSPAYYGEGRSAYLDLSGAVPIDDRWHVAWHAGLLHPFSENGATESNGADVRVAVGYDAGPVSLEAGWQVKAHAYLVATPPARALTASASWRF